MAKSGLSGHGFPEKKKKSFIEPKDEVFYVANMSKNLGISNFNQEVKIDLDTAIRVSKRKEKITKEDLFLIQLNN